MWVLVQLSGWQQQLKMRLTIIERHGGSAEGWRCSITHSWRNHSLISPGSPTGRRERQQTLLDLSYCHRRRLMACLQGLGGKLFHFTTLSEEHGYALFCYSTIKDVPNTTSFVSTWWSWYHFDSCRSATHAYAGTHAHTHTWENSFISNVSLAVCIHITSFNLCCCILRLVKCCWRCCGKVQAGLNFAQQSFPSEGNFLVNDGEKSKGGILLESTVQTVDQSSIHYRCHCKVFAVYCAQTLRSSLWDWLRT